MSNVMFSSLLLGGIIVFLFVFVLIDWLGQRKDRESKRRPAG
jgi:hypothetical protein